MNKPFSTSNTHAKYAKILVVEDNSDQWEIMKRAMHLHFSEIAIQRTATTEETLELLERWHDQEWEIPKFILLDLYLPQSSDGLQLLQKIKAMPNSFRRIPIILLTNSSDTSDIEKAYQLGISSYVVKPIEFADWVTLFQELRTYWWETVTLPPTQYSC